MKKNLSTSRIVNWVSGTIIVLILVSGVLFYFTTSDSLITTSSSTVTVGWSTSESTMMLPPIDPEISKELPHEQYQKLKDSINYAREMWNGRESGSSAKFLFIRSQINRRCSNCITLNDFHAKKENVFEDYLIRLSGWKLKTEGLHWQAPEYYVKGNQSYLRKRIFINTESINGGKIDKYEEVDVPVPFRVDINSKDIMIPVSQKTLDFSFYIFLLSTVLLFVYILYYIIADFIKFLIDVAKGNTFTSTNVNRLRFIALNLFLIPCVIISH